MRFAVCRRLTVTSMLVAICVSAVWVSEAAAAKGDRRTMIFVGTTSYSDGTTTTLGTSFGARWSLEFKRDLQWTIGGAYATTDGEFKDEATGNVTDVHVRSATANTGLTVLFNTDPGTNVIGFVGGGFSIISYDMDFDYPESEVGQTSGVGPGIFGNVGAEFRITRSVWFIPAFIASAHAIETESGDAFTLVSTGVVLSIRIGF